MIPYSNLFNCSFYSTNPYSETLKYWFGVQWSQSYLMGRRSLFSLGWPLIHLFFSYFIQLFLIPIYSVVPFIQFILTLRH